MFSFDNIFFIAEEGRRKSRKRKWTMKRPVLKADIKTEVEEEEDHLDEEVRTSTSKRRRKWLYAQLAAMRFRAPNRYPHCKLVLHN
jgi:hypothetical protein